MKLVNHKIEGIPFRAAHYTGGVIVPTIVVLHDTAGRLEKGNSAAYLASKNAPKASVHFVLERDGTVEQQIPTNRRGNHAGASSYHGRNSCNEFAVGIEIVNPGRMTASNGHGRAWWGQDFDWRDYALQSIKTPQHGDGVWMPYTAEQLATLPRLLIALFAGIPSLTDITTHWYVSPGRKVDTNPLMPLDQIKAEVLGHDDPADAAALAASEAAPIATMLKVTTAGSGLNMRRWPNTQNPNVIGSIPNGTIVPVLRSGQFDGRWWSLVLYDGREGWILETYTHPA